ncbi:MAG: ABC transporter substrate-binding protein [Actinobacteria bacterium]|nr:ABC transporter substrate-binding protein [Actinomycetota bacterium]
MILCTALLCTLLLLPSGCADSQFTIAKGMLFFGNGCDIPPFVSMEGGEPVGFTVDLVDEIAKRMSLHGQVVPTPLKNTVTELNAGEFDIALLLVRPEGEREVDYSVPFMEVTPAVFVVEGSPVKGEVDLSGKVVGALAGSKQLEMLEDMEALGRVVPYAANDLGFEALVNGEIDAFVAQKQISMATSERTGKTVMVSEIEVEVPEQLAFGVKKGNTELLNRVNETLEEIKKDGTLGELQNKWFESQD